MLTLFSIIQEDWDNQYSDGLNQLINSQNHLAGFGLKNPYSIENVDEIVNTIETHLQGRKMNLIENNINEAYKELYFFTTYQVNLGEYLNFYRNLKEKYKIIYDYLEGNLKSSIELSIKSKITELFKSKEQEIDNIIKENINKKLTTLENKFITIKLQGIEDKYSQLLNPYIGNKGNQTILNQIKKNKELLELNRKILILEKIHGYFEIRFKTFQEEINTHKKIIDNLVFLYNNPQR